MSDSEEFKAVAKGIIKGLTTLLVLMDRLENRPSARVLTLARGGAEEGEGALKSSPDRVKLPRRRAKNRG